MFKLFSRPKPNEASTSSLEKETDLSKEVGFGKEVISENNQEDIKTDFSQVLGDLKEAIKIKKELGTTSISPEEVFQITGLTPQEVFSYLEGEHFAIDISKRDVVQEIESSLVSLEAEKIQESGLRKFANNKMVRAAFVSLMLLAKMAPAAQAAPEKEGVKDEKKDRMEELAYTDSEKEANNTYYASAKDFRSEMARKTIDAKPLEIDVKETSNFIQLEMANYFDTDSDYIPVEAQKKIKSDFEKFLSCITPESAQELVSSEFKLYGSSDERMTNNWEGGNEELTKARLESAERILSSFLQNYPFENLPADLAEQLRAKTFEKVMPTSANGPEAGVTYIADLINPATGNNYTETEINILKTNNPDEYKKLLDDCRKISFEVETIKADEVEVENRPPDIEEKEDPNKPPAIERLNNWQNVSLLFDNSPSVGNSYNYMAEIVGNQDFGGLKVNFGTFSNQLDELKEYNSSQDVVKAINSIKFDGNSYEMTLTAVKSALEKMPEAQKNVVFAMTDEPFQDVSWESIQELKKMSAEKNAQIYFYYADDKSKAVRQISLADLEKALEKDLINDISSRISSIEKATESKLSSLERQYQMQVDRLEKFSKKDFNSAELKVYEALTLKAEELKNDAEKQRGIFSDLKSAWQEKSIEKLFANELLQERLNVTHSKSFNAEVIKKLSGEDLGIEVTRLSKIEK